ncbi:hypothetical protein [Anaeroselena agilis]|uniref:Nucleoside transporter/FeoB GTPase Gate domain-containing protein n=1 Tax=Anaeroselena agilis TaxID=3063788 RepID=A0ABU3NVF7_9FIRM|nr:hypothetical protein [Selenomonadales bacterium 4137-cl]
MSELAAAAWATVEIMKSVLPSLYVGLFLAGLFTSRGGVIGGRRLLPAVARLTGLPPACALSVVLAAGDRTAGMAAVALAKERAGLSNGEVIAANLVAKAPSVLRFFVFSFIPIMAALYPPGVAARFLAVYFAAFAVISLTGVVYARLLSGGRAGGCPVPAGKPVMGWPEAVRAAVAGSWRPFVNMAVWMAAMSYVAMLFIKTGYLQRLTDYLPILTRIGLDAGLLPLAGTGLVSMIGGVAAVGAALRDGAVPAATVVPLLLTVSLLHNFYDLFASSLPRAVGVFGRRLGVRVAASGFVVTQAVMLLALALAIKGII